MGCSCTFSPGGRVEKSSLLLRNLTYLKFTSRRCASEYYKLGTRFHRLPLHIRDHDIIQDNWQEYCKTAFTVSANRELPDLIQVLAMLENKFEAMHSAVFKGDGDAAERHICVAHKLVVEAQDRVNKLQYAVVQYEWLLELVGNVDEAAVVGEDRKSMEEAWKMALPKCCGKFDVDYGAS
ncbi:hypothetical protein PRZ48_005600 [Zasmidium cellare]|uniref:Uncharacterized protein n=1 Tax=Zasmidium cellare TaxID=395010 RepID=A0ABR0EKZ1_ZASCE|nr:hypothetical protein PRZ48_005600 [Zasmidium cellare]